LGKLSSPFEIAGPLTEALLMANLVRGYDVMRRTWKKLSMDVQQNYYGIMML
jgi:hypothetical protein